MVLFGRRVAIFTTFPRALNTVFRMMLGDFDWDEIRVTGYLDGFAWLMITLAVLNLLLLNMVLAIVMDGYTEVKKRSVSSDTLFQEITNICTSWWKIKQGIWVPLELIMEALNDIDAKYRKVEDVRKQATKSFHEAEQAKILQSTTAKSGTLMFDEVVDYDEPKIYILGRDSKAVIDMKVQPVNEEIRKFVGPGKIMLVSTNGSQVRVLHEDGNVRDYDIGNDMNFELELAEGVDPVMFDIDDDPTMVSQAISPERLTKIVAAYDPRGASMQRSQAVFLLEKTVRHYFMEHREDIDWTAMRQKVSKVEFRLSKIKAMIRDMQTGNHGFMTPTDEMKVLREYLKEFYASVHLDRQKTLNELRTKEVEVRALRKKLLIVESQVLSGNFGENDRRTRQGLPPVAPADRKVSSVYAPSQARTSVRSLWPVRSSVNSVWPVEEVTMDTAMSVTEGDIDTAMTPVSGKHVDLGSIDVEVMEESEDTLEQASSVGEFAVDEYALAAIDNQLGINSAVSIAERVLESGRVPWDQMTRRSIGVFNELSPFNTMNGELSDDESDDEDIDDLDSFSEESASEWQTEDDSVPSDLQTLSEI
jgi:hypothetical protein